MEKTRTMVKICGKEYMMAGYESEEYIHRVAIYVDRKMAELKSQYVNLNPGTLSVLTALNIADELLKADHAQLVEENKRLRAEHASEKEHRSNVSAIKKERSQLFDGYK